MFIGRETELDFFEKRYAEEKGQLIVLYGRRRVGKTETLREFCKISPMSFFPVRRLQTRYSSQNFQSRYYGKIFRPDNIFQNLQIGKKPFVRYLTCLMATEKN